MSIAMGRHGFQVSMRHRSHQRLKETVAWQDRQHAIFPGTFLSTPRLRLL